MEKKKDRGPECDKLEGEAVFLSLALPAFLLSAILLFLLLFFFYPKCYFQVINMAPGPSPRSASVFTNARLCGRPHLRI